MMWVAKSCMHMICQLAEHAAGFKHFSGFSNRIFFVNTKLLNVSQFMIAAAACGGATLYGPIQGFET